MEEKIRVLVTDDEEGMREGMRRVLERKNFYVDTAPDGETAIGLLQEQSYDLALVDLKMPGIGGFKVTEYINEKLADRTVVVIVSALATVEAAVEVTRKGAFDFLVKPFTPPDLLRVVERATGQLKLIRERQMYLTALNSERNLSRQMINSMQEGVIVININGQPVLMNPRAEYLLGVVYREQISLDALPFSQELRDALIAISRSVEKGGKLFQERIREIMMEIRMAPYRRDDETAGVVVIIDDISEAWEAEQDKNRFISMVAHELKSPLAAIINYINIIETGMFDTQIEKIHEMLARSKIRGEALLDLIRDLLFLNQRQAGKVEKSFERLDLKTVLAEQLVFFEGQAERDQIELSLLADQPEYPLCADRQDLDRIFMNLISNGLKYNRERGSLTLKLKIEGAWIQVAVIDTGIGMRAEEMQDLFQEFYRVKNPDTSGIPGTGLGLATVKRIIGEYNGRIEVSSEKGQGTTFTVTLPLSS